MLYYRVKKEFDNYPRYAYNNRGFLTIDSALVAGELYTELERQHVAVKDFVFEKIDIPKTRTYWNFGVRFEI